MSHSLKNSPDSTLMEIKVTPSEVIVLCSAINFSLGYAQHLPHDGRIMLRQFQERLVQYLPKSPELSSHPL